MRVRLGRVSLPGGRWCFTAALLMAAVSTGLITFLYHHEAVFYADGSQYYMQAARFASTGSLLPEDTPEPVTQYGEEISVRGGRSKVWMYPPGMAILLIAPFMFIFGAEAAFAVMPVLYLLTLVAFYVLCTRLVSGRTALLALLLAILMPCRNALFPSFLSHTASAFLLIIGLIFAEKWFRTGSGRAALACGGVLGLIPAFRYLETVYLIGIGLAALLQVARRKLPTRSFLLFCAGAVIPVALLAVYNTTFMGGPFRTGYSATGANSQFSASVFGTNAFPYLELIMSEFGPHMLLLAAAGFTAMYRTKRWGWLSRAMLLVSALVVLLYTAYLWPADMRFFMPLVYPMILSAAFFLEKLRETSVKLFRPVATATVLLSLIPTMHYFDFSMPVWEREGRIIETLVGEVRERCPEGSAMVVNTAVGWTLNVVGDYGLVLTETLDDASCTENLNLLLERFGSFYVLDSREIEDWLIRRLPPDTEVATLLCVEINDGSDRILTMPTLIMTAMGDVKFDLLLVSPASKYEAEGSVSPETLLINASSRRLRFIPPLRESIHPCES